MAALEFNLACTFRLLIYENEVRINQAKAQAILIANEVGKLFGDGSDSGEDDEIEIV